MRFLAYKLLLAGALLVTAITTASAQTQLHCMDATEGSFCPNGGVTGVISGSMLPPPGNFTIRTQGPSTFNVVGGIFCCGMQLRPASWTGTGTHPLLGFITWSFVPTMSAPISSIIPIQSGTCLPARGDLFFWIEGDMSALPGRQFRSTTWIHVRANNLTSCSPFNCESFTLMNGPVSFTDLNGPPGNIAFTLNSLDVVLSA